MQSFLSMRGNREIFFNFGHSRGAQPLMPFLSIHQCLFYYLAFDFFFIGFFFIAIPYNFFMVCPLLVIISYFSFHILVAYLIKFSYHWSFQCKNAIRDVVDVQCPLYKSSPIAGENNLYITILLSNKYYCIIASITLRYICICF